MTDIQKNGVAPTLAAVFTLTACAVVLLHAAQAAEAVRSGLRMCAGSVIPSLFPMIVLSQYMIKSGGAQQIGVLLNAPTKRLFGLPGVCGAAILTGMIGGYPAGARAAATLVESGQISRRDGERLANIAFCSGPGFTVGMIGAQLYKNKLAGLLILTAQMVSCIIIGMMWNGMQHVLRRKERASQIPHPTLNHAESRSSDAFVQSASDAAATVLTMCSFVVIFQVIVAMMDAAGVNALAEWVLEGIGLDAYKTVLLPCLSEVTAGSVMSVRLGLPFTAFVVGFGGLSVHFQNFAVCRCVGLRKATYFFWRTVQGLLCGLLVTAALQLPCFAQICQPAAALTGNDGTAAFSPVSNTCGILMLVMCLMSVICLPGEFHMPGKKGV